LEMYLNRVYYGHNAYGLGAASRVYFSKEPSQLTPAQAAFLAGLIQAPTYYDPQTHFERARARQLYVLHGMVTIGALTPADEQPAVEGAALRGLRDPAAGGGLWRSRSAAGRLRHLHDARPRHSSSCPEVGPGWRRAARLREREQRRPAGRQAGYGRGARLGGIRRLLQPGD